MSIFGNLEYLIFIVYLILFSSFLYYYNAHKGTGLSIGVIISLFVLKVGAGCANLFIHYREYVSNDIYFYYEQSMKELRGFSKNPSGFLNEWIFNWGDLSHHLNLLDRHDMLYLADLGPLIHSKYMNLANIFTMGSLYSDVIFFDILFFVGLLQLYKLFYKMQPEKKWFFVIAIFFTPSVLFWCSGIHKDGWVLMAISVLLYAVFNYSQTKQKKYLIWIVLSCILLFVTRYFVFLCFLPAFVFWLLYSRSNRGMLWFAISYAFLYALFFNLGKFTSIQPMDIIISKQEQFFKLHGYSDLQTPVLYPNLWSFIQNFPVALNHIFIRPYFSLIGPLKYQIAAIESWLVSGIMLLLFVFINRNKANFFFNVMILTFAFTMYIFIGYTTPNCGALIRYKSEFTAIMLPALIALSDLPFFKRFYTK